MAKEKQLKDVQDSPSRRSATLRKVRVIIGLILVVLVVALALIVTIHMRQRINSEASEAAKSLLWRGLQDDYIVFAGMLVVALGLVFGLVPKKRSAALCIITCTVWGIGLLITAEAAYLTAKTVIHSRQQDVSPEARHVVVVGMALNSNSSAPYELAARLDTAAAWWQGHQDSEIIVTTGTDFIPVETADGGEVTTVEDTVKSDLPRTTKKQGTTTASVMLNMLKNTGVPTRWITQEKKSTNTEEVFAQVITMKGIKSSTPIIIVTNGCYMNDTVRIAKEAGFTDVSRLPAPSAFGGYLTNILWETWLENDPVLVAAQ